MTNTEALKNLASAVCGVDISEIPGYTNAEIIQFIADNYGSSGGTVGSLTVTSEIGSTVGATKITVSPSIITGNSYAYKTSATSISKPDYLSTPTDVIAWDGVSEIKAEDGHRIAIYELNSNGKVVKFGTATIHINLG